jgi:hypothetical protein
MEDFGGRESVSSSNAEEARFGTMFELQCVCHMRVCLCTTCMGVCVCVCVCVRARPEFRASIPTKIIYTRAFLKITRHELEEKHGVHHACCNESE